MTMRHVTGKVLKTMALVTLELDGALVGALVAAGCAVGLGALVLVGFGAIVRVGVAVGGSVGFTVGVLVGGTGVAVGVSVGGTGVAVKVAVGGTGVAVGESVGGTAVAVGAGVAGVVQLNSNPAHRHSSSKRVNGRVDIRGILLSRVSSNGGQYGTPATGAPLTMSLRLT
jgi:hypothetical protein